MYLQALMEARWKPDVAKIRPDAGQARGDPRRRSIAWGIAKACHDADLSRGVTGEVHHVDAGYHAVGMKRPDAPDISLSNSLSRE